MNCSLRQELFERISVCAAGWVLLVVMLGNAGTPAAGGTAATGPTVEHFAWSPAGTLYLDGPALQALSPVRSGCGVSDDAGNVWLGTNSLGPYPGPRCILRGSGQVWLAFGDDYWNTDFGLEEGPGSAFCNQGQAEGFEQSSVTAFVFGSPLEGGDKGCFYFTDGRTVKKVWKNPDKGGRWWFKVIVASKGKHSPRSKGQSLPALEAGFSIKCLQVMPDGRLIVFGEGGFYEYRQGTLVCLLGFDDYKDKGPRSAKGGPEMPTQGILGGDGVFYVGTYFSGSGYSGRGPAVWRISSDAKQVEPYVQNRGKGDGAGMTTGYFCGPHIWSSMHNYRYIPPDCIFLMAHDDAWIRRVRNGRVSTLCADGEWRELDDYKKGLRNFRWWAPGPGGTATAVADTVSKFLVFRVSGIDYGKPVSGPLLDLPTDKGKE